MQRVSFRRMDEGKPTDYKFFSKLKDEFITPLLERILDALKDLDDSLVGHICEAKLLGSLNVTVFFSSITMVTQWVCIKTFVKFIAVINGLIVTKNFVSIGIKCHLIPIIVATRLHILHRWLMKFFHGHHLTLALS